MARTRDNRLNCWSVWFWNLVSNSTVNSPVSILVLTRARTLFKRMCIPFFVISCWLCEGILFKRLYSWSFDSIACRTWLTQGLFCIFWRLIKVYWRRSKFEFEKIIMIISRSWTLWDILWQPALISTGLRKCGRHLSCLSGILFWIDIIWAWSNCKCGSRSCMLHIFVEWESSFIKRRIRSVILAWSRRCALPNKIISWIIIMHICLVEHQTRWSAL